MNRELICAGPEAPEELHTYLKEYPAHALSILFKSEENGKALSIVAPFTADYPVSGNTVWYLCENGTCHAPQTDFDKLNLS